MRKTINLDREIAEFEAGEAAYKNSNGHLYFKGSQALKDGYQNAWMADNASSYTFGDNDADRAFEAHIDQLDSERASTISDRTVAILVAIAVGLMFIAPWLLTPEEVAR